MLTLKELLEHGTVRDIDEYNTNCAKTNGVRLDRSVVARWLKITHKYTYTGKRDSGNWRQLCIVHYPKDIHTEHSHIFIDPFRKLWRIDKKPQERLRFDHEYEKLGHKFDFENPTKLMQGDRVYMTGDSSEMGICDYNVRFNSYGTVMEDQQKYAKKILVCIDYIDHDDHATVLVNIRNLNPAICEGTY